MRDESICTCPECGKTVLVVSETADPADTEIVEVDRE
jgi:hypothetical protein